MPRFAANLSLLYPELPFLERFEAAAKDGFTGVEFLFAYGEKPQEIAARLQANGLQQVLLNAPPGGVDTASIEQAWGAGMRGVACMPERQAEFRSGMERALELAAALRCPRIHVMAGLPGTMDQTLAWDTYAHNLAWAAEQAKRQDASVLVEPLNARDVPGYLLRTQAQAHEMVQRVRVSNLQVQMDVYHCQITEGDIATRLAEYLPTGRVGHMQIAGVPERHEPDTGELNYAYLFERIDALGYTGWVGCEYRPRRGAVAGGTSQGLAWLRAARSNSKASAA